MAKVVLNTFCQFCFLQLFNQCNALKPLSSLSVQLLHSERYCSLFTIFFFAWRDLFLRIDNCLPLLDAGVFYRTNLLPHSFAHILCAIVSVHLQHGFTSPGLSIFFPFNTKKVTVECIIIFCFSSNFSHESDSKMYNFLLFFSF